jgi:hypothetical protein
LGKDQGKRNLENVSQYGHRYYLHQCYEALSNALEHRSIFQRVQQNLNINKCQSTDFEAHTAWITLIFISYTMLSLRKRFDDYETMRKVFRDFKNELLEITLVEKLWQIMEILYLEI